MTTNSAKTGPFVSVIIPALNSQETLGRCLDSVFKSEYRHFECIVVDDHSTDRTGEVAGAFSVRTIRLDRRRGAAGARNAGTAAAQGEILLFLDADVTVPVDGLTRIVKVLGENPDIAAVFGSYDAEPGCPDFLSQYRNLMHHFVHQSSSPEASTFWSACGAVRRDAFIKAGMYNEHTRMMEDIELGYRLKERNYRIRLDKDIRVKHYKHYSFFKLLRSDLFDRAIPWTKLMWQYRQFTQDLNLQGKHKLSALVVFILVIVLGLSFQSVWFMPAVPVLFSVFLLLNIEFYRFFLRRRGLVFAAKVVPLHMLYYGYSSLGYLIGTAQYLLTRGDKGSKMDQDISDRRS